MPWTGQPHNETAAGFTHGTRRHELLNLAFAARLISQPGLSREEAKHRYYVNLSQCASRDPWGSCKTFCRKTLLFSYEGGFVMSGGDHLMSLGFGAARSYGSDLEDGELRDLAGEAFGVPCIATAMAGFFLNRLAPWW